LKKTDTNRVRKRGERRYRPIMEKERQRESRSGKNNKRPFEKRPAYAVLGLLS